MTDIHFDATSDHGTRLDLNDSTPAAAPTGTVATPQDERWPRMELWSAGLDETASFAVCTETAVVWHGAFHPADWHYKASNQVSADTSAAQKAIFLAGTVRRHIGAESAHLTLHLAHQQVDRRVLETTAARERIIVELDVDDINPALSWCREPGAKHWRDADLTSIARTDQPVQERLW